MAVVRTLSNIQLVMVQCQQITSAIRMILDEVRQTQKPVERKPPDNKWQIMQLSDQPGTGFVQLG